MQLNEMKTTSFQSTDELLTSTYSGEVRERDKTVIQQLPSLPSEIQYKFLFFFLLLSV